MKARLYHHRARSALMRQPPHARIQQARRPRLHAKHRAALDGQPMLRQFPPQAFGFVAAAVSYEFIEGRPARGCRGTDSSSNAEALATRDISDKAASSSSTCSTISSAQTSPKLLLAKGSEG